MWPASAMLLPTRRLSIRVLSTLPSQSQPSPKILHPPWQERLDLLSGAIGMLERFERHPAQLAGSGHEWIGSADAKSERARNREVVASLDLAINESEYEVGLDGLCRQVLDPAFRLSTDDTAPGYMAYIPSGGLFHSAVADLLSNALNRYVTINEAAPALAAIERETIQWMCCEIVGWKHSTAGGVLTSGGAVANLVAVHAARRAALGNAQLPNATLYVSEQAHFCVAQAARFVGLQPKHVRSVASDATTLRMDPAALRRLVERDLADGLTPIAVCATLGTTNSGAVDDIRACAAITSEHQIWLHADAAYGGAFALTEEGRAALGPLELADSVVVDPHKGLFLPYGLGALLVRDQPKLLRANHEDGACMQPPAFFEGPGAEPTVDMMNLSPELTRDFRGLRLWLPLKLLGAAPFRAALSEKMMLAREASVAIESGGVPGLRVITSPCLSIFTFRLEPPGVSGDALDALNLQLLSRIHSRGNALLSPFRSVHGMAGDLSLRMAIVSHRTDRPTVDAAVRDILAAAAELAQPTPTEASRGAGLGGASSSMPSRSSSIESALGDPVRDYRELAALPVWRDLLDEKGARFRALDVCCGTGRWMQAFADLVLKAASATACDYVDLCPDSVAVLERRRKALLARGTLAAGNVLVADATKLPSEDMGQYDLVTNMHGLYGIRGSALEAAVKGMVRALKPGGTLVIAIAHRDVPGSPSFYDRIGRELVELGVTDAPYACVEDVVDAFAALGIDCEIPVGREALGGVPPTVAASLTLQTLQYTEQVAADDHVSLRRFVLEESGANSFPAHRALGASTGQGERTPSECLLALADVENRSGTGYAFAQRVGVLTFRQSALLPDIISEHIGPGGSCNYNDMYTARRQASTMQSNVMRHLTQHATTLLSERAGGNGAAPLKMLSIGCGSGELELSLLEGTAPSLPLDFLGLEPSDEMRSEFLRSVTERRRDGRVGREQSFALSDAAFLPAGDSSASSAVSLAERAGPFDLVFLGHVLYYFDDTAQVIEQARRLAKADGGRVVIVHQAAQGIPQLQCELLPLLRNSTAHMCTADDIIAGLPAGLEPQVDVVPAMMDISEIVADTHVGRQILSFAIEADLRNASETVVRHVRRSFLKAPAYAERDVDGVGPAGAIGPFLQEPTHIITLTGLAPSE